MGTSNVIELDGVAKRYRLGEHHGTGMDLRETLVRIGGRVLGRPPEPIHELWSLRDIDLEVPAGQALGIIGANGAGKSTLLKVISNITTPTLGRCRTRGRVGSLLEVGTGFHGELTGRENTYLNGAILGMTRREVTQRLDEIVDFAGLDEFMDTPVKRYSSGMYLRLGFSIAVHMDADVLIVDEVLAVGDAEFQRRCLSKMAEIERSGRTVLFVSHNMDAMARLCPQVVWLEHGRIRDRGDSGAIIDAYLRSGAPAGAGLTFDTDSSATAQIVRAALVDDRGVPRTVVPQRSRTWLEVDVDVRARTPGLDLAFVVSTSRGVDVVDEGLADDGRHDISAPGTYRVRASIPSSLVPGEYSLSLWLGTADADLALLEKRLGFTIEGGVDGRSRRLVKVSPTWEVAPPHADVHRSVADPTV